MYNKKAEFEKKEKWVFSIILGQCSTSLRSQLDGTSKFNETCEKNNIIELLKLIRGLYWEYDQNNDRVYDVMFQKSDVSNDDYLKEFQVQVAALDDYNENILDLIPCLLEKEMKEKYDEVRNVSEEE